MVKSVTICYVKRFSNLSDMYFPGKQPYFEISDMTTHPKPKTHSDPRPRSLMNVRLR